MAFRRSIARCSRAPICPSARSPRFAALHIGGEALPPEVGRRWLGHTGVDILDGLGSDGNAAHLLIQPPGEVRYGSRESRCRAMKSGWSTIDGNPSPAKSASCRLSGPTSAAYYWNNREKTPQHLFGPWTRSGDKYTESDDGYFTYCGRADDMLKVAASGFHLLRSKRRSHLTRESSKQRSSGSRRKRFDQTQSFRRASTRRRAIIALTANFSNM